MALTPEQQQELEVRVGPAAWTYYQTLAPAQQVNLDAAYAVRQSITLVAADVLEAACTAARRAGATAERGGLKAVKIEGIELQFAAATEGAAFTGDAADWCTRAASLRAEVATQRRFSGRQGSVSIPVEVGF